MDSCSLLAFPDPSAVVCVIREPVDEESRLTRSVVAEAKLQSIADRGIG